MGVDDRGLYLTAQQRGSFDRDVTRSPSRLVWGAGLIGILAAACEPPRVSRLYSTMHAVPAPEQAMRLVVYDALQVSADVGRDLVERLATCGVAASVVVADPMDPTPLERRLDAALAQQAAHTMLIVRATGGELGAISEVRVALEIVDVEIAKPLWEASGTAFFRYGHVEDGVAFSTLVVTKLRDDGVLSGCRTNEVYPGCREDQRRDLAKLSAPREPLAERHREPPRRCDVTVTGSAR